jgi:hypothetical protein
MGYVQKIAERQNIYILEVRGYLDAPPRREGASEKLFGTKTLVLVSKWFSTPHRGLGV